MTEFLRFDPSTCPQNLEDIPKFVDEMLLQIKVVVDLFKRWSLRRNLCRA